MTDENERSYGPYELRPGVNSLSFGSDPVVTLLAGKAFSTRELGVAAFLDEHPDVRRKAKPKSKAKAAAPAGADSGGIA